MRKIRSFLVIFDDSCKMKRKNAIFYPLKMPWDISHTHLPIEIQIPLKPLNSFCAQSGQRGPVLVQCQWVENVGLNKLYLER